MEIKLNQGDRLTLPAGCKAIVENGMVIIEKEDSPRYKDGDILALKYGAVFIYNSNALPQWTGNNYYAGVRRDSSLSIKKDYCLDYFFGYQSEIRGFATEEEKQKLFDVLAKNGLKWNAETKELEKVLPRTNKGGKFFSIKYDMTVVADKDLYMENYDKMYRSGNYFLSSIEARKYANKLREILTKRILND
ncbi:hypothetical protein [Bacteroides pyogenes]|uniref:hypothetical protein n=1 Tax=Bacteroides pyogenes TaxID=310300 RepID=UPI00373642D4